MGLCAHLADGKTEAQTGDVTLGAQITWEQQSYANPREPSTC